MPKSPNRMRVLRAEHRITQLDAAIKTGISPSRFWRLENGYDEPKPKECKALTRLFKVAVEDLFPARESQEIAS